MFEFVWPWLLCLLPLPLFFWFAGSKERKQQALRAPLFLYWQQLDAPQPQASSQFPWLKLIIWCLLVIAVSRPQWVDEPIDLPTTGRDLLLSVDISGSMEMPDMVVDNRPVDRLVAVKSILTQFVARRKGDRLGLILFGEQAYLQTPLTFDLNTVQLMLDESEIGLAGSSRTAIGDSIGLAIKRLQERDAKNRVLILLTDGQNNTGILSPVQAAELAEHAGVTIYTIGIGADEMIVQDNFFGSRKVNPSRELDERTLTIVAEKTGGQYFRARDTAELDAIYKTLDKLEPVEDDGNSYRPIKALFFLPLGLALLLSLLQSLSKLIKQYTFAQNGAKRAQGDGHA